MKKRIITAAAFAACLALCAAAWPQNEPVEETPAVPTPPVVTAAQPEVPEVPKTVEAVMAEKEKAETMEPEQTEEVVIAPEPTPVHIPPAEEMTEGSEQESEPTPALPESASNNMVYVEGFSWLESQGPNHVEYAEDMYENGNKIGSMG